MMAYLALPKEWGVYLTGGVIYCILAIREYYAH